MSVKMIHHLAHRVHFGKCSLSNKCGVASLYAVLTANNQHLFSSEECTGYDTVHVF
jgi:hypothetical protein